jgi:hypothetical protein
MSCYEWERGTITLSAKEWPTFRKSMLEVWNAGQEELFLQAQQCHTLCEAAAKGVRGAGERGEAMKKALGDFCRNDYDRVFTLTRMLLKTDGNWGSPVTLMAPKRAALDLKKVSQSANLETSDFSVGLVNETRSVVWDVPENNRARESAHAHWFATKLFTALSRVEWARGTGGTIVGNDEYHRDSDYEGGGGNYVVQRFGPKEAKAQRTGRTFVSYAR